MPLYKVIIKFCTHVLKYDNGTIVTDCKLYYKEFVQNFKRYMLVLLKHTSFCFKLKKMHLLSISSNIKNDYNYGRITTKIMKG